MFSDLSHSLCNILSLIRRKGVVTKQDLTRILRNIRIALLEADVSLSVVQQVIDYIYEQTLGQQVLKSVTPADMITKIVYDKLTKILCSDNQNLSVNKNSLSVYLLVGLQGVGKTTTATKLALYLKTQHKKKVLLVSLDTKRPAAQKQLEILARSIDVSSMNIITGQEPTFIIRRALELAQVSNMHAIIFDTAGVLHTNKQLMEELNRVRLLLKPLEILLIIDLMSGQDSIHSANMFYKYIGITGLILTRADAETRGGVALSVKEMTQCPIKFISTGEKLSNFEKFYPHRMAARILNMGDIVSLVDKAKNLIDKEASEDLARKIKKGGFDMEDLRHQLKNIKKIGGIIGVMKYMPGLKNFSSSQNNAKLLVYQEAIINSMTKKERMLPKILNASRKKRIARGCQLTVEHVNKLVKQFFVMRKMMQNFSKTDNSTILSNNHFFDTNILK